MQVSIEKVSAIKQVMTIAVPEEDVNKAMDARYHAVGKTAKVPGYRPGKVPLERLKQMYGASVRQEAVAKIMQDSYMEALRKKDLAACGYPTIKPVQTEAGQPLSFTAEFEVYPEIKLESFDGYEIVRPQASIAEKDIDDMVSKVQEQHKE